MQMTATLSIRQLTSAEAATPELLPHELRNFQFPYLIPDWCWVVEKNGLPICLIVTSMVHGVLFVWRVLATASAKHSLNHLLVAMPHVLDNAKVRGCIGWGCFLHDDRPLEVKVARIMQRIGKVEPWVGSVAIASLYEEPDA